jgi:putative flippase GtrA
MNIINFLWETGNKYYNSAELKFPWLKNFILYAFIGVIAAVFDYSIFFVINYFDIFSPEIASLTGNICGFMFTFTGNTFYNFKKSDHVLFRFLSYLLITICGMTLSTALIHYGKTIMNVYILKVILVLFVIPSIQFVLNKKITYRNFNK